MNPPLERVFEIPRLLARRAESHKGDYGHVLVIAGSRGFSGAAVLCGRAALSGGAGLVTVACPRDIQDIVAAGNPCYMTTDLPARIADFPRANVVAIGPGLGSTSSVATLVSEVVANFAGPLVIDADALAPAILAGVRRSVPAVLTPHPGEFARLIGRSVADVQADREELAVAFAREWGVVLVLKGSKTVVTDGVRIFVNDTGNPGMATGGSGDVLTGLIAALLGQRLPIFEAAILGVWAHGRAGDLAAAQVGEISLTAVDILDFLPAAITSSR